MLYIWLAHCALRYIYIYKPVKSFIKMREFLIVSHCCCCFCGGCFCIAAAIFACAVNFIDNHIL